MKKSLKIVSIIAIVAMMLTISSPVFASGVQPGTIIGDITPSNPSTESTNINLLINNVLGFLQWAAIIGGVLIITILGIKYMMGSLEEKADYKKSMVPLVIGIIVVMGATTIANILFKTLKV